MDGSVFSPVAVIRTAFPTKFGVPRQSGLVEKPYARVVFEPPYRNPDALRGIDGFSHLWLLWLFSENPRSDRSATVRPPRLGGNIRMGVFATRSPFRPNPIGLSCVRLVRVEGCDLIVSGADLVDGTPILDVKPYLPYTDSRPDAVAGFADEVNRSGYRLSVCVPPELASVLPPDLLEPLCAVLAEDPRPSYQSDPSRVYGFPFAGYEVRFRVDGGTLTVVSLEKTVP